MSARDAWRQDHHRNLFGTDKATPFLKNKQQEWQTSTRGTYTEQVFNSQSLPSAGHATFANPADYKQQLMSDIQRNTVGGAVPYTGIQHSEDDLVKLFR